MFLFKFSSSAAIYFSLSLVAIISITITRTKAQPIDINFAQYDCPNTSTFSPNSTFHSNLKTLLSWLPFNASHENGYYRTSIFESSESTVYGALLCRGDLTDAGCQYCGSIAVGAVLERCPVEKQSIIWYAQCMLRYSNQYFFSAVQVRPSRSLQSVDDISGQSRFRQLLDETMGKLADDAANGKGRNGTKFATREANFSSSKILYTLAQCTPDITVADCKECLQTAIRHLPSEKEGGRVMTPSCNVRFETAPFYTPSQVVAPPTIIESLPELKGKIRIPAGVFVAVVVSIVLFSLLLLFACWFTTRRARKKYISRTEENGEISSVEFLQFDLETINVATNNFSDDNKLGQGGFGAVYKGLLANGQYIAVKRLSRSSSQGAEEFKNEVVLVAKLQHRNLVRLLGFCLDGEEKILIYEFVTNNSLDHFLFDPDKKHRLHWSKRYKIIEGISRGLLYLHEDSRLKIIHRDLKASNILLDENLNSKISDFGMARIFCVDQTQANTNRIVGTFGYMPPEYALHGHLSVKLDVYSFGILVLEIISGKRNTSFHESGYAEDLLNYAWKKWREGTPLDLLDMSLKDSYSRDEVIRCIHIGLLCIQEDPAERPTMQAVVLMLNSHSVSLAMPQRPPSFLHSRSTAAGEPIPLSVDEATITEVYSR